MAHEMAIEFVHRSVPREVPEDTALWSLPYYAGGAAIDVGVPIADTDDFELACSQPVYLGRELL